MDEKQGVDDLDEPLAADRSPTDSDSRLSAWDRLPAKLRWTALGAATSLVATPLIFALRCAAPEKSGAEAPALEDPSAAPSSEGAVDGTADRNRGALRVRFDPKAPLGSREADALWQSAAAGDPLDLARLAQREGAGSLAEVVKGGERAGIVALQALPYAEDASASLGALCDVVRGTEEDVTVVLEALHAVASGVANGRAPPSKRAGILGEALDVEGQRHCIAVLKALLREGVTAGNLEPGARDLASSALRRLEQG